MYNKLFTKILDSSIWLENDSTRIVWFTMLAAMDQDGFAQFASIPNLAHRARVSIDATNDAIAVLEREDPHSSDPEHDGKRIERVPGGWMVLNAIKYQEIVTRSIHRLKVKERVAKHRASKLCNAPVTVCNALVTPSDTDTESKTDTKADKNKHMGAAAPKPPRVSQEAFTRALEVYNAYPLKVARPAALKAIVRALEAIPFDDLLAKTKAYAAARGADLAFVPHPATWFNQQRYNDDPNTWKRNETALKPNPRNAGIAKPATGGDYGEAAKRKLERQALEAKNRLASEAQGDGDACGCLLFGNVENAADGPPARSGGQ